MQPSVLLAGLIGFLAAAAVAILARGLAGDEEAFHALIARYAPAHPELFLDVAGRPLVTLLLALPAQFGLIGARLASAVATGLACAGTARAAMAAGLSPRWAAPFLLLQPFFLAHAGTAMAEPWAAMLVAWGLVGWLERRWTLLVLTGALLPLARLELIALLAPVLVRALAERRWRVPFLLAAPLAAWGLLAIMNGGDPAWLGERALRGEYPPRPLAHYLHAFSWMTGAAWTPLVVLGLAAAAFPAAFGGTGRQRRGLLAAASTLVLALAVYTFFASVRPVTFGNLRYGASLAPLLALLALGGLQEFRGGPRRPRVVALGIAAGLALTVWGHPWYRDFTPLERFDLAPGVIAAAWLLLLLLPGAIRRAAPGVAILAALAILGRNHQDTLHLRPTPEHDALYALAGMFPPDAVDAAPILATHPVLAYALGLDPHDPGRFPAVDDTALVAAPAATILVWDSHYGPTRTPGLELEALLERRDWRYHRGVLAADSAFAAAVFLRPRAEEDGEVATFTNPPLSYDAWVSGALLARSGAPREAQLAEADPGNAARWRAAAQAYLAAARLPQARECLTRASALEADDPRNDLIAAELHRREGNPEAALAAVHRALEQAPDWGEAVFLAGAILAENRRTAEARPYLLRAAELMPERWDVRYVAARILALEGNWAEARDHFDAAVRGAPADSEAPFRAAEAAVEHGDPAAAEGWLTLAIQAHPRRVRLHLMLATLLADLGRREEAVRVLDHGLRQAGMDPRLLRLRAALAPDGN